MTEPPAPGRTCPSDYGYSPLAFARTPGLTAEVLYVDLDTLAVGAGLARLWPPGSDAAVLYGSRIVDGPAFSIDDALGRSTASNCIALAA